MTVRSVPVREWDGERERRQWPPLHRIFERFGKILCDIADRVDGLLPAVACLRQQPVDGPRLTEQLATVVDTTGHVSAGSLAQPP